MSYQQMLELAEGLGVTGPLVGARWFADRAAALNAALAERRAEVERDYAELATELAEGTVGVMEVEVRTAAAALWAHDAPAARVYVAAVAACHRRAEAEMASSAGALFSALVDVVDEVVSESARRRLPAGVVNEATAARAGVSETWTALTELLARWKSAHGLAWELRNATWVPGYAGDSRELFLRYKFPGRLPEGYWQMAGERQLAEAYRAGARPGLYPADDAMERWRDAERAARERERSLRDLGTVPMNVYGVIQ